MTDWIWLVPLLPFVGALLNGVVLKGRVSKQVVSWVACGLVGLAAALSIVIVADAFGSPEFDTGEGFETSLYVWVPSGLLKLVDGSFADLTIELGFLLDPLSAVMMLVVTFVGFWIHVYSIGYMGHEDGYQRYFAYLNLFMGAMLMLVLGNNFLVMFVGWEGVGLCSYLLIGYYFDQDFPPYAGRKAFIVNRIGDFAFLLALFALVAHFGTLDFHDIFARVAAHPEAMQEPYLLGLSVAGFVTLCLFLGATGKSAQIPLYVWLPDAMAGPTPVSALIHAATMVTAGVYMVVRTNVLFQLAPEISAVVAIVGALTAIFAATIGLAQTDIKKVLAYSTVSQLGYMFLAAGVGAYSAAIFHLGTHAFFKALLFLGSGSVIHAMSGEQDMRHMGGLKRYLPATYLTFTIGTLAIAGIPPLAGFFSKDQILAAAFAEHKILWAIGLLTAGMTAFYMFRMWYMTFHGSFRGTVGQRDHLHESPRVMTVPLWVLAVGAVIAGWIGVPRLGDFDWNLFDRFLSPVIVDLEHHGGSHAHHPSVAVELALMALSVAVALVGIYTARLYYGGSKGLAGGRRWAERFPALHRVLWNKYYVDEAYDATVVKGTWGLARLLHRFDVRAIDGFGVHGARNLTVVSSLISGFFDKYVVDGLVNLTGWILHQGSAFLRRLQTGLVSQYAFVLALGAFVLVCLYIVARVV
jgi:NADH-quinone oxidoreductase subunit L